MDTLALCLSQACRGDLSWKEGAEEVTESMSRAGCGRIKAAHIVVRAHNLGFTLWQGSHTERATQDSGLNLDCVLVICYCSLWHKDFHCRDESKKKKG